VTTAKRLLVMVTMATSNDSSSTRGIIIWLAIFAVLVAFAWTLLIVVVVGMVLLT
jgi:hypothetical protein